MKILGQSILSIGNKTTIIEKVRKKLGLESGDEIVFLENNDDDVVIKNLSNTEVEEVIK